jgi:two-component system, NtrC family, sensor kinase
MISIITIGFALIASLGFVVALFVSYSISSSTEIREKTEAACLRLSNALEDPIWNLNEEGIRTIARSELSDENILAIVLRDEMGQVILALERLPPGGGKADSGIRAVAPNELGDLARRSFYGRERDILHGGAKIGDIAVYSTDRGTSRAFLSKVSTSVGLSLGTSIVLAFLLFFAIDRLVSNRVVRLVGVVSRFSARDFTARAELSRNDEIGELERTFNSMAETIQRHERSLNEAIDERTKQILDMEKFAFLGSLVAGVAHEVNTPLGVSVTAASHAKTLIDSIRKEYEDGGLDEEGFARSLKGALESLGIVEMNLERAAEFIRTFKQVAVDQTVEGVRSVKLREYLQEIVLSLRPKLRKGDVKVEILVPAEIELVCAPGALYQIFTNLIVNSLVHAFDDGVPGTIAISGRRDGNRLELSYRDDGKGMTADIVEKIFAPFFTTKRNAGGTGLGLYIVQTTIGKMGGQVRCVSEPGKGVDFLITIPA